MCQVDEQLENWAADHAENYRGCLACRQSHHVTSFCPDCGRCYFKAECTDGTRYGLFVRCACGHVDLWD